MSVATASAVLRERLTRTISRALPRLSAAIAHAQPTLPVPIIPIFMTSHDFVSSIHTLSSPRKQGPLEYGSPATGSPRRERREVPLAGTTAHNPTANYKPNRALLAWNAGRLEQEPSAPL